MSWTIRRAKRDDRTRLAEILGASLRGLGFVPQLHTPGEDQAFMAGLLLSAEVWVADTDDGPVGFIAVAKDIVPALYILPDWQGQGIGSALLNAAKDGRTDLTLYCFQQNEIALKFYAKEGFRETARDNQGHNDEGLPDVTLCWDNLDLWAQGAAWQNDAIIPIQKARMGVTDWGLTHSDITYDVVPVWKGAFFRLGDYLDRFEASIASMRLDVRMERAQIAEALEAMVARSGLREAYCAMVASRGVPAIPGDRDPRNCVNHFYAWCVPYVHVIKPEIADQGASVLIPDGVRRIPADSVDPTAKNYHWGDFTRALLEAKDAGFETTLLLDHAGNITEGPGFNAFAVYGSRVVTPDTGVLGGITRRTVLEMAEASGMSVEVRPLPLDEFLEADEVFLSSSGGGVLPVTRVGERIFSNGAPGAVGTRLRRTYFEWLASTDLRHEISYAE